MRSDCQGQKKQLSPLRSCLDIYSSAVDESRKVKRFTNMVPILGVSFDVPTCSNWIFDDLWYFLTSYLLAVKNEFKSLFFFEAVWDALILWSSMVISNIEVNGPAFDGWRQSRTDAKKPGVASGFASLGPWSGLEVEEVNISWFQLVWLNTSSPQKRNSPEKTFPIQTLEGPDMFFFGTTRGCDLIGGTWFRTFSCKHCGIKSLPLRRVLS